MKHLMLTLTILACSMVSCITVSQTLAVGEIEERTVTFSEEINTLAISSGFDVIVDKTIPRGEVHITTNSDMYEYIDVSTKDATLNIKLKSTMLRAEILEARIPEYNYNGIAISGGADLEWFDCNVPLLTVAASGGADAEISGTIEEMSIASSGGADIDMQVNGTTIAVAASGGADVEIDGTFADVSIAVSGGADIDMQGSCTTLSVTASGGADASLDELLAEDVTVDASSGAGADVYASKSLKATATSGADISYSGNPEVLDIKKSSGGSVKAER